MGRGVKASGACGHGMFEGGRCLCTSQPFFGIGIEGLNCYTSGIHLALGAVGWKDLRGRPM